jgi:small subunit ribosomal protein S4
VGVYTGPKCRLCRREGDKLYLKGARCHSNRCAFAKREYPPGKRTYGRRRPSAYAVRLREKQKLKRVFGLFEKQFRLDFERAERMKGNTGENLLVLLERRLDNVVFWSGFALSRRAARQMVRHKKFTVNGRRVDIPSYKIRAGDVIKPVKNEKLKAAIQESIEAAKEREAPMWIVVDAENLEFRIDRLPKRDDIKFAVQEQLIVELCSR